MSPEEIAQQNKELLSWIEQELATIDGVYLRNILIMLKQALENAYHKK